ncbi:hypothetical protein KIN20_003578 [Parelaphostrongylus tenuis]|uniref:Uncharacterized protein n=1 Tax=Parelaphostrongylus tenuis TaxID=148309 RepID=A0AAD5MFW4_PARTN|nr:hypothetical protein KIN20_003578 [Parelaphostrongylus tenuis]
MSSGTVHSIQCKAYGNEVKKSDHREASLNEHASQLCRGPRLSIIKAPNHHVASFIRPPSSSHPDQIYGTLVESAEHLSMRYACFANGGSQYHTTAQVAAHPAFTPRRFEAFLISHCVRWQQDFVESPQKEAEELWTNRCQRIQKRLFTHDEGSTTLLYHFNRSALCEVRLLGRHLID